MLLRALLTKTSLLVSSHLQVCAQFFLAYCNCSGLSEEAFIYFFKFRIMCVSWEIGAKLYSHVCVCAVQKYCLGRCVLFMHLKTALFSKQEHVRFLSGNLVFLMMEGNRDARKVLEVLLPKVGFSAVEDLCRL